MKFKIITLGCKVNTYESNSISDTLLANGYEKALDDKQAVLSLLIHVRLTIQPIINHSK